MKTKMKKIAIFLVVTLFFVCGEMIAQISVRHSDKNQIANKIKKANPDYEGYEDLSQTFYDSLYVCYNPFFNPLRYMMQIGKVENMFYDYEYEDFDYSEIEILEIPDSLPLIKPANSIYDGDFYGIVDMITYGAFARSKIRKIRLPKTLRIIEPQAFFASNLEEIRIPGGVKDVQRQAFESCFSLEKAYIEDGVETLGFKCFSGCLKLRFIDLPSTLKRFEGYVFYDSAIRTIVCRAEVPPVADLLDFGWVDEGDPCIWPDWLTGWDCTTVVPLSKLYVPKESIEAYKTAPGWSRYATLIEILPLEEFREGNDDEVVTPGSVEPAMISELPFTVEGDKICVVGHPNDTLTITDINGLTLDSKEFKTEEEYFYTGSGIVIVTLNGKSAKVVL